MYKYNGWFLRDKLYEKWSNSVIIWYTFTYNDCNGILLIYVYLIEFL